MTDFRAWGAIMGPTGLTAVFGMGTGVAPSAWPPEMRLGGVFRPPGRGGFGMLGQDAFAMGRAALHAPLLRKNPSPDPERSARPTHVESASPAWWRGGPIGVVKPLGC